MSRPEAPAASPAPPTVTPVSLVIVAGAAEVTYHCTAPQGVEAIIEIGPENGARPFICDQPGAKVRLVPGASDKEVSRLHVSHAEAPLNTDVRVTLDHLTGRLEYHVSEASTTTTVTENGSVPSTVVTGTPAAIRAMLMLHNQTGAPWKSVTPLEVKCDNITAQIPEIDLSPTGTMTALTLHETRLKNELGYWVTDTEFEKGKGKAKVRLLGTAWPKAFTVPRPIQVKWNGKLTVIVPPGATDAERSEGFKKFTTARFVEFPLQNEPPIEVSLGHAYSEFTRLKPPNDLFRWRVKESDLFEHLSPNIRQSASVLYEKSKTVQEVPRQDTPVEGQFRTNEREIGLRIEMGAATAKDVLNAVMRIAGIKQEASSSPEQMEFLTAIGLRLLLIHSDLLKVEEELKDLRRRIHAGEAHLRRRVEELEAYAGALVETWNRQIALDLPPLRLEDLLKLAKDVGLVMD